MTLTTEEFVRPIQRALISTSNKEGLHELTRLLAALRVEIYSTGGTARHIASAGIPVRDVTDYTDFPEMLDGRVKTLHPKIFAGILSRLDHAEDQAALQRFGIATFGLVVVNLYPFEETIRRDDIEPSDAIEQIDIGGPSLIRAAAKNHAFVTVVTAPDQYPALIDELERQGGTTLDFRQRCMVRAFAHTAKYDQAIADYFARQFPADEAPAPEPEVFPQHLHLRFSRREVLRYGENSHQRAALYRSEQRATGSIVDAIQHHGKQLSYNNILDLDAAWQLVTAQSEAACAVIKHNNPCGAAVAADLATACRQAFAGDPLSAFGGVTAMNRVVDIATAEWLVGEPDLFVEAIAAQGFAPEALEWLITKAKWRTNVRLLTVGVATPTSGSWDLRTIAGGLLVQEPDNQPDDAAAWELVVPGAVGDGLLSDLEFAWSVVRIVRSNAIVIVRDGMVVGVGAGQMSRVDSVKIALAKAGERARGAALASDAFFPFADSIELAVEAGIRAIVQTGGAKRDEEIIRAAAQGGIAMYFTKTRHFRH